MVGYRHDVSNKRPPKKHTRIDAERFLRTEHSVDTHVFENSNTCVSTECTVTFRYERAPPSGIKIMCSSCPR